LIPKERWGIKLEELNGLIATPGDRLDVKTVPEFARRCAARSKAHQSHLNMELINFVDSRLGAL
jgi:hypothetical protein